MFKNGDVLKDKLGKISAKSLIPGGKQFLRNRNEQKIKYAEGFTYCPLSGPTCLRVLRINPGADTDVISCDLFEVKLDESPVYEALSYTWSLDQQWSFAKLDLKMVADEKHEERPILCNGKTLHVTMNLYHALAEFRRMKIESQIWADQVCINQQDDEEKVSQLAIMKQIYSSAKRVIIWLGKLNSVRSQALDFMESLPDEVAVTTPVTVTSSVDVKMFNKISQPFERVSALANSASTHYHWFGALLILGREWFRRIWTLQELVLATDFVIFMGNREISSSTIIKTATQFNHIYATDPLAVRYGFNATATSLKVLIEQRASIFEERHKYQNGKRYSTEEYLKFARARKATVDKDKVFAAAALLKDSLPTTVTYFSTTLEVYMVFSAERLWPETEIFSLSLVGGAQSTIEGLPSWCVDLSKYLRPRPLRYCGCPIFSTPIAPERQSFHIEDKTLHIKAAKWDTVKAVGESGWSWSNSKYSEEPYNSDPPYKLRTSTIPAQEKFGMMFAMLNELGTTYTPTGERTIDAFWKTLIGGAASLSDEDSTVWLARFHRWFAFTLLDIRSTLASEKKSPTGGGLLSSEVKKWMVPLIQDRSKMEERVASFLEVHDQRIETADIENAPPVKKVISEVAKRIWGAENVEEADSFRLEVTRIMSLDSGDGFFAPIGVFGELFETVYDGRRIFVTEEGYMGISAEGVKAGDSICLVPGAEVPYIFRPIESKGASFTLVGEAYVHGVMSGEEFTKSDMTFEDIHIL